MTDIVMIRLIGAAAIVAASAASCRAAPAARETLLGVENIETIECSAQNCFVVAENAQYCSIDPYTIIDGGLFTTKSTLTLPSGVFALPPSKKGLLRLSVDPDDKLAAPVIETSFGRVVVSPQNGFAFEIRKEEETDGAEGLEWIELTASHRDDAIDLNNLLIRTSRWPHDQFHMGDPNDVKWFFEAARNLYISFPGGGAIFPGAPAMSVHFAPCDMSGLDDRHFEFQFENGDQLSVNVRFINGSAQIGYYVGRVMSAQGMISGRDIFIEDRNDLAFFGSSRSWAEPAIPGIAIRFEESGDICGVILDASNWDASAAVNGYFAFAMTCDQRRGAPLALSSVAYPEIFVMP